MGPIQTLPELLRWLRRRARMIALIGLLGTLLGVFAALKSDRIYAATAVIQIITPAIGDGSSEGSVTRRVQTIEQQLMSRENLLELAARHGMFEDMPLTAMERVTLMRQSITIQAVAAAAEAPGRPGGLSALIITASADRAETAAAIANELAEALLRESASARQERTEQTLRFYQQDEARLEAEIAALEDRIAVYQSENEALMPAALTLRRDELGRLEENRLSIEREIVQMQSELAGLDATSQRTVTQRRISQLQDDIARRTDEAALITRRIETIHALMLRAPEVERELNAMERRITQLQTQLTSTAERRRDAEIGQRIESDQQAERFELLEAALVPEYPVSRSRRQIAVLGAMAGLFLGLGLAYLAEWMRPVLRTAQQMERELQLRPVISIPYVTPPQERRRRRMIWLFGAGVLGLGLMLVALQLI